MCTENRRGSGAREGHLAIAAMIRGCSDKTKFSLETFHKGKRGKILTNTNLETYGHMIVSW